MTHQLLRPVFALSLAVIVGACGGDANPTGGSGVTTPVGPSTIASGGASSSCAATVSGNPGAVPGSGGRYTLAVVTASGCGWTAQADVPWVSVAPGTGTGSAAPVMTVDENPDAGNTRSANVTIGGQVLHVSQANACTYTLDVTSADFNSDASRMGVRLTTRDGCAWTATVTESWVRLNPARGSGSELIDVEVTSNPGGVRHATATIAGKRLPISQQSR